METFKIKMKDLFNETLEKIKLIPELRSLSEYDFTEFNLLLSKSLEITEISKDLYNVCDIDTLLESYEKNEDKITKELLNYTPRIRIDVFSVYDIEVYRNQSLFQKKLLTYRRILEALLFIYLTNAQSTATVSKKYFFHILDILYLSQLNDYLKLGYKKTIHHRAAEKKTGKYIEVPSKSIEKEIKKLYNKIKKFSLEETKLTDIEIKNIEDHYNYWWESYKNYIDENFPVLRDIIDYYKGVKVKVVVAETETPESYVDTGIVVCEAYQTSSEGLMIEIEPMIKKILFINDEFGEDEYNNLIINWGFNLKDELETKERVNSYVKSDVDNQVINLYKASIQDDEFFNLAKVVLSSDGYQCGEKTDNGIFVNSRCKFSQNSKNIVIVKKDFINDDQTKYNVYFTNNFNEKWLKGIKEVDEVVVLSSSVVSTKDKDKAKNKKIYIKDIDDIFVSLKSKLRYNEVFSNYIFNDIIYPYLESKNGSFKSNKNIVKAEKLIDRLNKCPQGTEGWRDFEKLTYDILHFLFNDSFENFRIKEQVRNSSGTNIRDFIILNNGKHSFWKDIKQFYDCRNIIIEVKNTGNEIGNDEFRQVADYLSRETIGKFGIIFSRNGLSSQGEIKQREHLTNRDKELILVLDDDSIIDLIRKKSNDESPEEIFESLKFDLETSI